MGTKWLGMGKAPVFFSTPKRKWYSNDRKQCSVAYPITQYLESNLNLPAVIDSSTTQEVDCNCHGDGYQGNGSKKSEVH